VAKVNGYQTRRTLTLLGVMLEHNKTFHPKPKKSLIDRRKSYS